MAVIDPTPGNLRIAGVDTVSWSAVTESDTVNPDKPGGSRPSVASVQVSGTFGGATVILQGSNDGVNWVSLNDLSGTPISISSAGAAEFSSAMAQFRPSISGGSSQSLTVTVAYRG